MQKISKKKITIVLATLCLSVIAIIGGWGYNILFSPNFQINKKSYVYIYPQTSFDDLCDQLKDSMQCKSINNFRTLAKILKYPSNMKTGRYEISPHMNNLMLVNNLKKSHQSAVRFTFNNIRFKSDLTNRIKEELMLNADSLLVLLNDSSYCASFGFTPQTISSMFIPNTYELYWNMSMPNFMKRMKKEYDAFWNKDRLNKATEIGFTPAQVATIASIVEEESANSNEYSIIAGLYINRLKKGIPLQADPTVKFAIGDFSIKRILFEHLEIDSPYNTYKYSGLPPGPLRVPSRKAIDSVLNYARHNYLYMCAKEDFSGTHNFASTLEQHSVNAQRYRAALNRKGIK